MIASIESQMIDLVELHEIDQVKQQMIASIE